MTTAVPTDGVVRRFVTRAPRARATFAREDTPSVSVVMVAYGTADVLTSTLDSLAETVAAQRVEVVVVDNPHPDRPGRARSLLRLFTNGVRVVVPDHNVGFGGGCELGALHARGEFLVFLNPDVVCPVGWLEPLLETASVDGVGIVAPVLLDPEGTVQEAGQRLRSDGSTTPHTDRPTSHDPVDVDYSSAACWVMRRDVHERLGGFDPAYHPAYFEDVDLALRARSFGYRVVVDPRVEMVHRHGQGTTQRAAPALAQRDVLLARWPEIRWSQNDGRQSGANTSATTRRA